MSFPQYANTKDSGVQWLGQIPQHWSCSPIKAVATCNDDVLEETTPADYEMQYVEISDVDVQHGVKGTSPVTFGTAPSRARRRVRDGDIIVSTVRTYLRAIAPIKQPPENLIVSTGFAVVRSRAISSAFLGYLFQSEFVISNIISRSVGVSYPAINAREMMSIYIPIPELWEQSAIALFLDRETTKIDALVDEQQRLIELLKEKRQAIISDALTKGLDPMAPTKASGVEQLGDIPQHWSVGPLKRFVRQRPGAIKTGPFGSQLTSAEMLAGEIKVYNQRNVIDGEFETGENFITAEKFAALSAFETFPGDVLVSTRGTIGRAAILPPDAKRGILHPCVLRVQPEPSVLSAEYLRALVQDSHLLRSQIDLESNATTIEVIYSETMASLIIPVPPLSEQMAILAFLYQETAKIDGLMNEVEGAVSLLQERRSALISAAVTGKINVGGLVEADAPMRDVVAA